MGYHQLSYLLGFLPLVLLLFSICPKRSRRYVLAGASWLYFFLCSRYLIVYLLGTTVWVYLMGIWIGKLGEGLPESAAAASREPYKNQARAHQAVMLLANGVLFGVLFYLKYTGFFVRQLNRLVVHAGGAVIIVPRLLVPIGISFYTLEAVGYLLEVYWRRIPADRDFIRIALFLGFFPQTMEGPIARYGDTAMQFSDPLKKTGKPEDGVPRTLEEMTASAMRICWGMFKKLVVADRLNIIVATLFGEYEKQNGVLIIVAAVCYTVQLYMEFSGMMDVVIGSARLFGIRLPENFRQPFFSQTASEFWRRWHISLGAWLKDYLFLSGRGIGSSQKAGEKAPEKVRTVCGEAGRLRTGTDTCLAVQRSVAWRGVELHLLRDLLSRAADPGAGA
jgi:D-alanyl-lipoteichoic acid acyltransferase DltB (MBOAT superfamily)